MLEIVANLVGIILTVIGLLCLVLSPWYRDYHSPIYQRTTKEVKVIAVGMFYGLSFTLAGILFLASVH